MAVGFISYNDSGVVQIDETTRNMQLLNKGTISSWTTFANWTPIKTHTLTVPFSTSPNCPLLAIRVPARSSTQSSAGVEQMVGFLSGIEKNTTLSRWEFTVAIVGGQVNRTDPSPEVEWWSFSPPKNPATSDYGLQVFTNGGVCTFDGSKGVLEVKGVLTNGASLTVPSGKKYATFLNAYMVYDFNIDINIGTPGVVV
jgi:hypothetical protein